LLAIAAVVSFAPSLLATQFIITLTCGDPFTGETFAVSYHTPNPFIYGPGCEELIGPQFPTLKIRFQSSQQSAIASQPRLAAAPTPSDTFPFCAVNALLPGYTNGQITGAPFLVAQPGSGSSPFLQLLQARTAQLDCPGRSHNPYGAGAASPNSGLASGPLAGFRLANAGTASARAAGSGVTVTVFNPDGSTGFTTSYTTGNGAQGIVVGDFNGDGNADLAVVNTGDFLSIPGTVSVLLGRGDGTFQNAVNYLSASNGLEALAIGDFNNDGKQDLIVVGPTTALLLGNGDGTFRVGPTPPATNSFTVAVTDVNNDGKPDLVVASGVLPGNGDGTFRALIPFPNAAVNNFNFVAVADFNSDGKPDLAGLTANALVMLKGNGDGSFQAWGAYATPFYEGGPDSLIVADIDSDGNLDVVLGNGNSQVIGPTASTNTISIYLGNGDGTLQAAPYFLMGAAGQISGTAVADFTGDNKPDIAANDSNGNLYLLTNQGGLQFKQSLVNAPSGILQIAAADLNGDGKPDLIGIEVVQFQATGNVIVMLGNGDGTFQAPRKFAVGMLPYTVAIGDVNGDGHPDIVAVTQVNAAQSQSKNAVSVLIGHGDGTFAAAASYAVGSNPVSVAIADFNGDGKNDFAVADFGTAGTPSDSGDVSVLLNKGDGTFQSAVKIATGGNPSAVVAADFNNDGKQDLAVINSGTSTLSVFSGGGNGAFQAPTSIALTNFPTGLLAADFDHDGNIDLAATGSIDTTILINQGGGVFTPVDMIAGSHNLGPAALMDLNGDGRAELVVAATAGVIVFPGAGPIPAMAPVTLASSPSGLTVSIDGISCITPCLIGLTPGQQHSIAAATQSAATGSRSIFVSWSDGGAGSHNITSPSVATTYTATFTTQYQLTTSATPTGSGSVAVNPPSSDGYYNNGTSVQVTAMPSAGYGFFAWSSGITGSNSSQSVTMSAARSVTANFVSTTYTGPGVGLASSQGGNSYSFSFNDTAGYQNLSVVNVLINNVLDGRHACYLAYVVSSGTLLLVDDAGDAGGPFAGSVTQGNPGTLIQNSQCAVSLTSAGGNGTGLALTLNITFNSAFAGNKIFYLAARDNSGGNTDWQAGNVVQVPPAPSGQITTANVFTASGAGTSGVSGTARTFAFSFTDTKGPADLGVVNVLVNNFIDGRRACYLAYVVSSNLLFLVDDAGDAGGPYAGGMALDGNVATIQNSQCSVSGVGSSASQSGNALTLTLNITFQPGFLGHKIMWVAGRDAAGGNNTDWQAMKTWFVQ
jgi:hypothetical protein